MSSAEFGSFTLLLLLLITTAHLLGYAFTRIRQPRVVGELLAGVLLGPSVLGFIAPALSQPLSTHQSGGDQITGIMGFYPWVSC